MIWDYLGRDKNLPVLQSIFIMLFLIAAIGFDILSETKTWNYPDYVCVVTEESVMGTYLLRMGMVMDYNNCLSETMGCSVMDLHALVKKDLET